MALLPALRERVEEAVMTWVHVHNEAYVSAPASVRKDLLKADVPGELS